MLEYSISINAHQIYSGSLRFMSLKSYFFNEQQQHYSQEICHRGRWDFQIYLFMFRRAFKQSAFVKYVPQQTKASTGMLVGHVYTKHQGPSEECNGGQTRGSSLSPQLLFPLFTFFSPPLTLLMFSFGEQGGRL